MTPLLRSSAPLAVPWLGAFLVSLDVSALNIALPTISSHFRVDLSATSWAALAYLLMLVGSTPAVGVISERYGYRRIWFVGFSLFVVGSVCCALSDGIVLLSLSRGVQGIGGSVLYVMGPATIRRVLPEEDHSRAFGIYATAFSAGICLGPAVGGFVTGHLGWQWIFLMNVPICAAGIASLGALPSGENGHRRPERFDLAGTLLSFVGLAALIVGLNRGSEMGWTSPAVLGCFGVAVLSLAAFVRRELRFPSPALDLRLLGNAAFGLGNLSFMLYLFVFGGAMFLIPFQLEWFRGLSTHAAGLVIMIQPLSLILVATQAGRLSKRLSANRMRILGGLVMAVSVALLGNLSRTAPTEVFCLALAVMGIGAGLYVPKNMETIMESVAVDRAGSASSLTSIVRSVAQLLGILVFETIFSEFVGLSQVGGHTSVSQSPASLDTLGYAFNLVFWIGTATALLSVVPFIIAGAFSGEEHTDDSR